MRKKIISFLLCTSLLIGLCSCGNADKVDNDEASTEQIVDLTSETAQETDISEETPAESTAEIADEISDHTEEKQVVTDFYDALYTLYSVVSNGSYTSLSSEISKAYDAVIEFDNLASSYNFAYKDYYTELVNDSNYYAFKYTFIDNDNNCDFDYYITTSGYASLVETELESILAIELPFEYSGDTNVTVSQVNYSEACKNFTTVISESIDNGLDAIDEKDSSSEPGFGLGHVIRLPDKSVYHVGNEELEFDVHICYYEEGWVLFGFYLCDYDDRSFVPTAVNVSNGVDSVNFNSTYLYTYNGFNAIDVYSGDNSDSMNEKFDEFYEYVLSSNSLTLSSEGIELTLTDEDFSTLKSFTELGYIMLQMYGYR